MKLKFFELPAVIAATLGWMNSGQAQTNAIIFPRLFSTNNAVLMTNAEYRYFSGSKLFFRNSDDVYHPVYLSFQAQQLSTNVLAALHVVVEQMHQAKLDEQRRKDQAKAASNGLDSFDSLAQKELSESEHPDQTADRILQNIDDFFRIKIERAEIDGQSDSVINNIETMRDKEKLRIVDMAIAVAKKQESLSQKNLQTAQSNLDAFNADPIRFLEGHPAPTNSGNQ